MRGWSLALCCLVALGVSFTGCDGEPEPASAPTPSAEPAAAAKAIAPQPPPTSPVPNPARVADLETMCERVEHDYNDGTLTDYFSGLKVGTDWGNAVLRRGDASTQPGRVLEAAADELGYTPEPNERSACGRLFDVLDDLE
jgi:hypothetical protein